MSQLSCHHLNKSFDGHNAVLQDLSFNLPKGQRIALVGPSGCGKSTLIRILAGLERADSGHLISDGQKVDDLASLGVLSYVFQDANLLPWRTVWENVALPLELAGIEPDEEHLRRTLEGVGLGQSSGLYPHELSGGMKMRASLARALVTEPAFLLLDEPFGALDELTRERMGDEFLKLWRAHRPTTLLITHDVNEAVVLSDVVHVMAPHPGRIVASVPVESVGQRDLQWRESDGTLQTVRRVSAILRGGQP